jgi:endonuclease I
MRWSFFANSCFASKLGLAALLALPARGLAQNFDPPPNYYATATGTGATLKNNLHNIIRGHTVRSYDQMRQALPVVDRDPSNSSNLILIYTGTSVTGSWDGGVTWNREHSWPTSRGVGTSGPDYSDLHQLRPCNPTVNDNRGNLPFGIGTGYWDPNQSAGVNDRGEMARAMFYMDTRYNGSEPDTVDLSLVNGMPTGNQMGDLARLLQWHYQEPVSLQDRRRNHLIYSSADNPLYFQGNRNPFIDHPEFVWAIWGGANNNSRLYVGIVSPPNGISSGTVDLGRVMRNGSLSTGTIRLNKSGSHPTTFDISATGPVVSPSIGPRQAFDYNAQTRDLSVTLQPGVTASTGIKTGTLTINNTDLTSAGAGLGSADGDDTITVTTTVVDNRTIHSPTIRLGPVIANQPIPATATFTTSGTDDRFTRVTLRGTSAGNGVATVAPSTDVLFNSPTSQANRNVTFVFPSAGPASGTVPMSVLGEGLAGEVVKPVSLLYTATPLYQATASFHDLTEGMVSSLCIDFGTVDLSEPAVSRTFSITNVGGASGWAAGLDLDQILGSDPSGQFFTDLSPFANLPAGEIRDFTATLRPRTIGRHTLDLLLGFSDQDIPGASAPGSRTMTLSLVAHVIPEPAVLAWVMAAGLLLQRTSKRRSAV